MLQAGKVLQQRARVQLRNLRMSTCIYFRENTEDIYAGIEFMNGTPEADKVKKFLIADMGVKSIRFPETSSIGIRPF